jgi:hypothetical protein
VTRHQSAAGGLAWAAMVAMVLWGGYREYTAVASITPDGKGNRPAHARPVPPRAYGQAGVTCAMLPGAIAEQESGGNYRARSNVGALGKYQIMPGNVPEWTRAATGRAATAAQFLASPPLQERTARFQLGRLCDQYGARGAAAAWFSGRPELHNDYRYRGGGAASVGAYVDAVMAHARRENR